MGETTRSEGRDAPTYEHEQVGWLVLGLTSGMGVLVLSLFLPAIGPLALPIGLSIVGVGLLFGTLAVSVDDESIRLRFGPGLVRRTIPVAEVTDARVVRNRWWYGWGIRLTPRGWLWNVSGLDAVEIDFEGGRHFRIGTDEPEALARAIQAVIRPAAPPTP